MKVFGIIIDIIIILYESMGVHNMFVLQIGSNIINRVHYVIIVNIYKYCYYIFGQLFGTKMAPTEKICLLSDGDRPTFFGYHDKTPFSGDGMKILAMSIGASDTEVNSECTQMQIGYFVKNDNGGFDNTFHSVTETTIWCWQQGCMLQWNPANPSREIIYNNLLNGFYGSQVFDIMDCRVVRNYQYPIYSVSPCGNYAITLNFSRLGRLRPGYGYTLLEDKTKGDTAPQDDGLFLLDIRTGERKILVSLADLALQIDGREADHYVNHAVFSSDSLKISFFHIWHTKENKRKVRLCLYRLDKSYWEEIEGAERSVSHYCWCNDDEIMVTHSDNHGGRMVSIYNIKLGTREEQISLAVSDTHPMRSPKNENIFIMDSKPDIQRKQHLYVYNRKQKHISNIGFLFSPYKYTGVVRCDLHPRWDRDGKYIVVDTASDSRRQLALINVSEMVEEIQDV